MCDHENQECPGRACHCPCMNCLGGNEPVLGPIKFTYPRYHRVANAENRKTGQTLGAYNFEHKEGWTSDGANYTGAHAYAGWIAALKKLVA